MAIHDMPGKKCVKMATLAVTSTTVEVALPAIPDGCSAAVIYVGTDAITYTLDGTDPNTAGITAAAADTLILRTADQVRGFKAVKVTNNAALGIAYFGTR